MNNDSSKKIISFSACTGMGMYDPIFIDVTLADGTQKNLQYDGRSPLTPKQFLESDGYTVDCEKNDWKWPNKK